MVEHDLDYDAACFRYGDEHQLPLWQLLGDVMAHRTGWRFALVNDDEPIWCFGSFGTALLTIFVNERDQFECFDYYDEVVERFKAVTDVLTWIDGREASATARGVGPYELLRHDNWKLLGTHTLDLDVTWFDGYFSGVVRSIPGEVTFQTDLVTTVAAAAQMVAMHVGAPAEMAAIVTFRVHLDEAASRHLIHP